MNALCRRVCVLAIAVTAVASVGAAGTAQNAAAALPPGNAVEQWNKIAEDTVVGSGAFQNEGLIYMAYESAAVYDAVVAIEGGYSAVRRSRRRCDAARRPTRQWSKLRIGRS